MVEIDEIKNKSELNLDHPKKEFFNGKRRLLLKNRLKTYKITYKIIIL